MIVATLREIKKGENRVALTPNGAKDLIKNGHSVLVQSGAGAGTGFSDEDYTASGAIILKDPIEIAKRADIIVKIKEPLPEEYVVLDNFKGKILFTYLHLAGAPKKLTEKLLENRITAIAYETVVGRGGGLPLLKPMSEIAGVLAVQYGAQFLQKKYDGEGITLSYIENTDDACVVLVGGGTAGAKAALTAAGLGASVIILEIKDERIEQLKKELRKFLGPNLYKNVTFLKSNERETEDAVKKADLLIGAVLVPGARAPKVVTKQMVQKMKKGSVIIDISIDQGGCIWGSRPTTHEDPIFKIDGKIFCCIPNIPGQVALQSTQALTSATLPYLLKLADKGISALREDDGFALGLNTYGGKITCLPVAEALGMMNEYKGIEEIDFNDND